MGEAKRMASAWESDPPYVANKGRPLLPDDRERMLWQAMLAVAPAVYANADGGTLCSKIAGDTRQLANALLREWEQQCRPDLRRA